MSATMAIVATRPSTNIAQKVERQPQRLPIAVPAGTPMMLETVRPASIDGDRHAALLFRHQADRHDHGDAEIGAVRHRDREAQQQHRLEVGRERAGGLSDGEDDGEPMSRILRETRAVASVSTGPPTAMPMA